MNQNRKCLFTIIIAAHNRAKSLKNLINSLSNADYDSQVINLIISIDTSRFVDVLEVASNFKWNYGNKKVIVHKEQKGLKNHFLWCGDQTNEVGPVLFLEEDMMVSRYYVKYVNEYLNFYSDDSRVAGSSLYSIHFNEMITTNFIPIDDGSDVFFYQQPYWGTIYHPKKWKEFRSWYNKKNYDWGLLPMNVQNWGDNSFKKAYILYLIVNKKYFVFPRISLATNMGVAGLHTSNLVEYQTPLLFGQKKWKFINFDESCSIYDAYQEMVPNIIKKFNPLLSEYNIDVDLNGTKHTINSDYVLTLKKSKNYVFKFSHHLKPLIANVMYNIEGDSIFLIKKDQRFNIGRNSRRSRIKLMYLSLKTNNIINKKKMILMTLLSFIYRDR